MSESFTIESDFENAQKILFEWEQTRPDVTALASIASLARRIESELLRALRLDMDPGWFVGEQRPTVGTEAALWFSPFVESRGPDSITLPPEFACLLREKLAGTSDLLEAARRIVLKCHAKAPPVIQWEEELIYLILSREGTDAVRGTEIDRQVARAIKALVSGKRSGLAEWIIEMGPRLPQTRASAPFLARLQTATYACLQNEGISMSSSQRDDAFFANSPMKIIEVARGSHGFKIGDLFGLGQFGIRVPALEPITIQLLGSDSSELLQTVTIPTGGFVEIPAERDTTRIRAIDGKVYELKFEVIQTGLNIRGIPYISVSFDNEGRLLNDPVLPPGTTDLIAIAHSWNYTSADAEAFYSRLFESFSDQIRNDPAYRRRKIAIVGVLWPSKRFDPSQMQEEGARGFLGNLFSSAVSVAANFLNTATFFEMMKRAEAIGKEGVAPLIDVLAPTVEHIHLVGHSFGGRLAVAAAAASKTGKLYSLSLLQAAFSLYEFSKKHGGRFRSVVGEKRVLGPILITYTKNDMALKIAYSAAARISDDAPRFARANDRYDAIGSDGAQGMEEGEVSLSATALLPVGSVYHWQPGCIHNLESSQFIVSQDGGNAHGLVFIPEVAWAISRAVVSESST